MRLAPRAIVSDFAIERTVGHGGVGIVYLAKSLTDGKPVALKILRPELMQNKRRVFEFLHEAELGQRMQIPGLVSAFAVGQEDDLYYLAMEYVPGLSLSSVLDSNGRIGITRALRITERSAEVLGAAWTNYQLVHCDIKPGNVMLTADKDVKIVDLGVAMTAPEAAAEADSDFCGTPRYLAPERLLGKPLDVRSDIYSLGATLYHILTGCFPYGHIANTRGAMEIAMAHARERLIPPNCLMPDIPPNVSRLIQGMMAKRPEHRYTDFDALLIDLRLVMAGEAPWHPLAPNAQEPLQLDEITPYIESDKYEMNSAPDLDNDIGTCWWNCRNMPYAFGAVFEDVDSHEVYQSLVEDLGAGNLPIIDIPQNVARMVRLLNASELDFAEMADLANHSPALAGEFLRVANSAVYSRGVKIRDIRLALTRIAPATIKALLYLNALRISVKGDKCVERIASGIIDHSFCVATVCQHLAPHFQLEREAAFMAGLLHDAGKLAILRVLWEAKAIPPEQAPSVTEDSFNEILPVMHERAGGLLARHWELDEDLTFAVSRHHTFYADQDESTIVNKNWAALVGLGDTIARMLGKGRPIAGVHIFELASARQLGLQPDSKTLALLEPIPQLLTETGL